MPTKSPGLEAQEEQTKEQTTIFQPTPEVMKAISFHKNRLNKALQARNSPDRSFDYLNFIQDFYSNEDAVNSFLKPKRNDDDVRVVGGSTEKRVESVVNELQSFNYQHEIQAYDEKDRMVRGLGKAMEDVVTRTNQIEHDENTLSDALWELITQRVVIVEEILEEKRVGKFYIKQPRKRVRSALEVIFGDLTMGWYMTQEQPFIATYDRMSIRTASMFFGHYDNWKYVRGGMDLSTDVYGTDVTFRLGILQEEEVEVIRYMSVPDNEYQIYINGVPMEKMGEKLPFQYPFPRYPLSVAIPKRMGHHRLYGRSMASALKYLQAFSDETVRNIIRKFRQAIEPPRGVKSNDRIYTRDMYVAGKISYGVDVDAIKPLTDHNGVTDAEMSVMNLVKQMQDELSSRTDVSMGAAPGKKQSATSIVEQQKQAVKMLGQVVLAWSSLVQQMTENRIYNVIENLSEPDGMEYHPDTDTFVETFRRFTLNNQPLDNGKSGDSVVQFIGHDLKPDEHEAIDGWEQKQMENGQPVSMKLVNIKRLKEMSLQWFITVNSKPKESDDLHKLMFQDKFSQAQSISQVIQRPLNPERIVDEFEEAWRAKDWFGEPQEMPQPDQAQQDGQGGDGGEQAPPEGAAPTMPAGKLGGAMKNGIKAGTKRPPMPAQKPAQMANMMGK